MTLETIDPRSLGERLRDARTRAGLTQEDAAVALRVARTTLVAIEKGQRRIRPDELRGAEKAYGVAASSLVRSDAVQVSVVPRFRALPAVQSDAAAEAGPLLTDLAAAELELERLLGSPMRPNLPPERPIGPGNVEEQARDAAAELRHRLGLGMAPVRDTIGLLELELGVRVFIRPLASAISGAFLYDPQVGACILLNRKQRRRRRALTAWHEVGHLVGSRHEPAVLDLGRAPQTREEKFANAFALEFTMPAAIVRNRFADMRREAGRFAPRHLIVLARYFDISIEAMCRRLEELGLLPSGTWESLRERGFSGEQVREVIGGADEEEDQAATPRLWLLATEAHRRGLLSEGQLARRLRLNRIEVRAILDELGGTETEEDDLGSIAPGD